MAMKCRTQQASGAARANRIAGTAQHAAEDQREQETRVARRRGFQARTSAMAHCTANRTRKVRCVPNGELRHDFVTHFTGTSLALR